MKCQIVETAKAEFESKQEALKLLGINNVKDFQHFLSLFMTNENYETYLNNQKELNAKPANTNTNESSVSAVDNNSKEPEVNTIVGSDANKIMTGETVTDNGENDGRTNEKNEDSTVVADAKRTEENATEVEQDEIVENETIENETVSETKEPEIDEFKQSVMDKILEIDAELVDYTTDDGVDKLMEMSTEEIDSLIKKEAEAYTKYAELLKEKHSFEKEKKSKDGRYKYVQDTVVSSLRVIEKLISHYYNKFHDYKNKSMSKHNTWYNEARFELKEQEYKERNFDKLHEAKEAVEKIKEDMDIINSNREVYKLAKARNKFQELVDFVNNLDSETYEKKIESSILNSAKNTSEHIFNDSKKLYRMRKELQAEGIDYELNPEYRKLSDKVKHMTNDLKTNTAAINFYLEHRGNVTSFVKFTATGVEAEVQINFDNFMYNPNNRSEEIVSANKAMATKKILKETIYNPGDNLFDKEVSKVSEDYNKIGLSIDGFILMKNGSKLYNRFAPYYSINSKQRRFYGVRDLPRYLTQDNKVLYSKFDFGITDKDNKESAENKKREVIARTIYNVLKSKGPSFQKRMLKDNWKKKFEFIDKVLQPGSIASDAHKSKAIEGLLGLEIAQSVIDLNNLNFEFPAIYKSITDAEKESKNPKNSTKDMDVETAEFNELGQLIISSVDKNSQKFKDMKSKSEKIIWKDELKHFNENAIISIMQMIPGAKTVEVSVDKVDSKGNKQSGAVANLQNQFEIPDNVKESIKVHSVAILEDLLKMINLSSNDDEFEDVWGLENFDGDMKDLESIARQGYLPKSVIVAKLGNAIYKDLGFKFSSFVSTSTIEGIKTELGLYAIEAMKATEIFDNNPDNIQTYNVGSASKEKTQALIKFSPKSKFHRDENGNIIDTRGEFTIEDYKNISSLMNHLYDFDDKKKPSLEKIEPKYNRTVRNSFQEVSQDTNRILNDYESVEHKFNPMIKETYDLWARDPELAYNMYGIANIKEVGVSEDTNYNGNKYNIEDAMVQASKFNNERLEFDKLMEFFEEHGLDDDGNIKEDVTFYFPWDYTVSGRYMVDSNVNPQTGKTATRYLIQSKQMDTSMKMTDGKFDKDEFYQFKVGIAQGLGAGIDKSTDETAFKKLEDIVSIVDDGSVEFKRDNGELSYQEKGFLFFRKLIDDSFSGFKDDEKSQEFVKTVLGEFDNFQTEYKKVLEDPSQNAKKWLEHNSAGSLFMEFIGHPVHAGEETHTLTALRTLAEMHKFKSEATSGSEVFNHTFTTEADDITSGMILTLMGLGTKIARMFLEKGGVYTKEAQEFWHDVFTNLRNIDNPEIKNIIENSYFKNESPYLTHGLLAEFGKLMDNEKNKADVVKALQTIDAEKYNDDVIDSRVHFKDFYNTVAKEAKNNLKYIKETLDDILEPDEELVNQKVVFAKKQFGDNQRDYMQRVYNESTKILSSVINGNNEVYSALNKVTFDTRHLVKNIYSEVNIKSDATKFGEGKTVVDYVETQLFKNIDSILNVKDFDGDSKTGLSFVASDKESFKKNYLMHIYRSFLKDVSPDLSKNIKTVEDATANMNEFIKRNVKDEKTLDDFQRHFRKRFTKNMNKYVFNKTIENISKNGDKNHILKSLANKTTEIKNALTEATKELGDKDQKIKDISTFDIADAYRSRVIEKALIEIAGDDISRNAAKSPVMTFIYGSSINTIVKSIANIIGKEAVYNFIIKGKMRGKDEPTLFDDLTNVDHMFDSNDKKKNLLFSQKVILNEMLNGSITKNNIDGIEIKNIAKFKKVNNKDKIVENMTDEEINEALNNSDLTNMIINEDMMESIYKANKNTYGKAFGDTFKKLFGELTKSREIIKVNELVRYSIYKLKLNQAFMELAISKGLIENKDEYNDTIQFELTEDDIRIVRGKLERDGFGHSVEDSNGARQSLNKMTAGLIGKKVSLKIVEERKHTDEKDKGYSSFSGSFKSETENTGAAPVTGIHQLDGRKIGLSLEGTGQLNIYDAFYSSSNLLDKTSDMMNQKFLETVEGYNLIRQSLIEVERMLLSLSDKDRLDILNTLFNSDTERGIFEQGMKKINPDFDIFRAGLGENRYWFGPEFETARWQETFENINYSLTNSTDVLVRHNQLSDSAKGHRGKAFTHSDEDIDAGLIFSFFRDMVRSARNAYELQNGIDYNHTELDSLVDTEYQKYNEKESLDAVDDLRKTVTRNKAVYNEKIAKIESLVKGFRKNSESFKNIIDDFKKCIAD